jgi:hypothetical protein
VLVRGRLVLGAALTLHGDANRFRDEAGGVVVRQVAGQKSGAGARDSRSAARQQPPACRREPSAGVWRSRDPTLQHFLVAQYDDLEVHRSDAEPSARDPAVAGRS